MKQDRGIRSRVLVLAVLPTLLVSVALAIFFLSTYHNDLHNGLRQRAQTIARHVAFASELGLETDNRFVLDRLVTITSRSDSDISGLMVFDRNNQSLLPLTNQRLLTRLRWPGKNIPVKETILERRDYFLVFVPVTYRGMPLSEDDLSKYMRTGGEERPLGYVALEISTASAELAGYRAVLTTIIIVLSSIGLGLALASRMARKVTLPIIHMADIVDQIRLGNLHARVEIETGGELASLKTGINAMGESMQLAQDEMSQRVEQATADLTQTLETIEVQNIELDMARKHAQAASRTKSEFLANVSHEIRTPMNGVIGFCNLLFKTDLNSKQGEYLTTIKNSASGLLAIINDILDFSKIEAGKIRLEKSEVNIRDCIEDVLEMLAPTANEKNLELVGFVYHEVPDEIIGDSIRIKQILINLVNNAVKFTECGSVVVRVRVEQVGQDTTLLRVIVSDTGLGLNKAQQGKLFESFSQADASTSRKFGGTGLGLAISKKLVHKMGGKIGVDSNTGEGSDFWFTLRLQNADTPKKPPENYWEGHQVLLYDEHKIAARATGSILSNWGFQVFEFNHAEDFLAALAQQSDDSQHVGSDHPPLVIFSSYAGDPFLEKLQRFLHTVPEFAGLLLGLSRRADHDELVVLEKMGARSVIAKPVIRTKLHQAIEQLLPSATFSASIQAEADSSSTTNRNNSAIMGSHLCVLVADDNEANRRLVCALLDELQVSSETAENGREAVDMACAREFDLILMDVQMPILDGIAATRLIRNNSRNKGTPIIAVTAHAMEGEKQKLLASGLDDYLPKPIQEGSLSHILAQWSVHEKTSPHLATTDVPDAPGTTSTAEKELPGSGIDWSDCLRLANKNEALAEDMLVMLTQELGQNRIEIERLFLGHELDALKTTVHKFHGACCYTGVPLLRALVENFESHLKCHSLEGGEPILHAILEEIDAIEKDFGNNSRFTGRQTSSTPNV